MKYSRRTILQLAFVACALMTLSSTSTLAQVETTTATDNESKETKADEPAWLTISPTGAEASFDAPIKPRYVERSFSPIEGKPPIKVHLHLATTNEGKSTFIFGYHDLHEIPKDNKELAATLDGAVKGSVANVYGQLMGKTIPIKFKGATGRQFVYRFQQAQKVPNSEQEVNKIFVVTSRVFLLGRRQYQISCLMQSSIFEEQLAAKFLNSFRFTEEEKKDETEKE